MLEQAPAIETDAIIAEKITPRRLDEVVQVPASLSQEDRRALGAARTAVELELGYPIPTWVDNAYRVKGLPGRMRRVARIAALNGREVPQRSSDVETLTTIGEYL